MTTVFPIDVAATNASFTKVQDKPYLKKGNSEYLSPEDETKG
jgi:hypothetical protein